jgi:hypothetical protein
MVAWIIGVVVLAAVVWAFWPRRRGIADGELSRRRARAETRAARHDGTLSGHDNLFGGGSPF